MTKPTFVHYDGTEILVLDYSRARGEVLRERLAEAGRLITGQPPRSLLILARVSDLEFTPDSSRLLLDHIQSNAPYSLATAVVGLGHLSKVIPVANRLAGRDLRSFDDEPEALRWLASVKAREDDRDEAVRFVEHRGERIPRSTSAAVRESSSSDGSRRRRRSFETPIPPRCSRSPFSTDSPTTRRRPPC